MDFVRTAKSENATLDSQMLLDHLELQQMWWFNFGDTLYQVAPPVDTAHRGSNAVLNTFGSDRVG